MKKIILFLILFMGMAYFKLWAAIVFNATNNLQDNTTTLAVPHTCTGNDLLLVVGTGGRLSANVVSSVTYAGANLTQAAHCVNPSSNATADIWYLVNPPAGAGTVIVAQSAAGSRDAIVSSWRGISQISSNEGFDKTAQNRASAVTLVSTSITPSHDEELMIDYFVTESSTTSSQTGGNTTIVKVDGGSYNTGSSYFIGGTRAARTFSWTQASLDVQCQVVTSFKVKKNKNKFSNVQINSAKVLK